MTESTTLQTNLYLGDPVQAPTVSVPGTSPTGTTPTTGIYYDGNKYVDGSTGQPAEGNFGGVTYKGGQIVGGEIGGTDFEVQTGLEVPPGTSIPYLLHIYYDFDQSYLRDEDMPDLENLYSMLTSNPDYIVEIGSHTDSRGTGAYNDRLSQRRAESVVRWLVDKGVQKDRLVARGYGETMNVNNCANNIPCSETEHQFNRRTEFRILGCAGCTDNTQISQPKSNPKLDSCQGCPF